MERPIDLAGAEAQRDPHGFLQRLRERSAVVWSDVHRAWLLTRHEEVRLAFLDPRLSADRTGSFERWAERAPAFRTAAELFRGWMIFRDPPAHDRLRDPVRRAFTPHTVEALAPAVERITEGLLDQVARRRTCDLRAVFARPLPALVIAELLGVPTSDRERFQAWSDDLARLVFAVESRSGDAGAARAAERFFAYFEERIAEQRRDPDAHRDHLIARMLASSGDTGLSEAELVGACTLLLFAGHETTTSLITNASALLLDDPELRAALAADPSLDATAVDEFLRFAGPAKVMVRRVAEPHERGGHRLERGDRVFLVLMAANADPAVFERPEVLDLARDPNPHFGFGWGLHHCLGASLARLETRVALRGWIERFPDLQGADQARRYGGGVLGHSLPTLPVHVPAGGIR